tara:strand:- start:578 stop:802 length:225 start_codon:yes stop_codon:yes gene_type:complete
MAIKGKAAKSASGASMSKYDVEVEARLQKLEEAVKALQSDSHPDRGTSEGTDTASLQEQIDVINQFVASARRRL